MQPVHRGINDIGTWKSALRAADMGLRSKLYDLYEDILMDGTVTDAIGKRIEAITDCDINFTVNGKEVPRITELIDTVEFENQLKEIMWSLFLGNIRRRIFFRERVRLQQYPAQAHTAQREADTAAPRRYGRNQLQR